MASAFDPGTLDAVAGFAAIAVERAQLLFERHEAELVRQRADLASTLLASVSHDLRTPLTVITVAVSNLQDPNLDAGARFSLVVPTQSQRLASVDIRESDRPTASPHDDRHVASDA